jgi:superfamily II DNA or RNA helicase
MLNLRDYQERFCADINRAWLNYRAVLGVLPTGGGKTVCFSKLLYDHKGYGAAVVHRKEIVGQISFALAQLGVKHRVIAPDSVVTRVRRRHLKLLGKSYIDPNAKVGVISVQTLTSAASASNRLLQNWLTQVTLAVFDEGHHYVQSGFWAKAVEYLKRARLLFVTATPERADGKGLGAHCSGFAECLIEGPPTHQLITRGYLSRFEYKAPASDLNTDSIPLTASGDLNTRVLRARVVASHLVGDCVKHYARFAAGKRAIVFASDVTSAHEIAGAFMESGVPAAALSGETEGGERDARIDDFEDGRLLVLVNVDLFDEGFDVPAVECVIHARPTESLAKYLQMCGRGLRIAEGKTRAVIIDPVRNWERHGQPHWPRRWTLEGTVKRAGVMPQRVCLNCSQPYERFYPECPYCGESAPKPTPAQRHKIAAVDGDLIDLDIDALSAVFAAIKRADMPEEDYAVDQMWRGIPAIGRPKDMRRHQENKYRRAVLRELIAWWVGMQPLTRSLNEKHRRFYYRFGVDIGTALTLKAADTDALIETIKLNFEEDIRP